MSSVKDKPLQMYKQRTLQPASDPTTVSTSLVSVLDRQSGENSIVSFEQIPLDDIQPIAFRKGK